MIELVYVTDVNNLNRPLAIVQKSLDRTLFLYIFIHKVRSNDVRASIAIALIRKFCKILHNIARS